MILQFPLAHEDELLASVLARFITRQGLRDDKVALEVLFGSRNIVPSALLQGHIGELLIRVGHLWSITSEELIFRHSILPIFKPFVERDRYLAISEELVVDDKSRSMVKIGINASSLKYPRYYRYCPLCANEDLQNYAYQYWRRQFQLPGVKVCSKHRCLLRSTIFELKPSRRHMFIDPMSIDIPNTSIVVEVCQEKNLITLAQDIVELLHTDFAYISPEQWTVFYDERLRESGLKSSTGVHHKQVGFLVEQFWGRELLYEVGLEFSGEVTWLHTFFRKQRKHFSYLHHLLCLRSLFPEYSLKHAIDAASKVNVQFKKNSYFSSKASIRSAEYRDLWVGLCLQHHTLKAIRKTREGARIYSWLYRYDNNWLTDNLPKRATNNVGRVVDWRQRDLQLVKELLKILRRVEEQYSLPRNTISWFISQLGVRWGVREHLDKLPLCRSFFIKYAETVEEYQVRRVLAIMVSAIDNREPFPKTYEIERLAGLSKKRIRRPAAEILKMDFDKFSSYTAVSGRFRAL
jgi:hypothetical protein